MVKFGNMKKLSKVYKELGIAFTLPIQIKDENNNETYYENSDGHWDRYEYDEKDNETYYEGGNGTKKGPCDGKFITNWIVRSIN